MYEKFLALIVVFLVGVLLSSMLFPSGRKQSEYFVDCTPRGVAPEGTVVAFVGTVAPTGWLMCDGQAYSKTTYASLFAVIGEKFGSTGSTAGANDMFRVPDLRGMFIRGLDAGAIRDVDVSARESLNGGFTGANIGSYQKDAVQHHGHTVWGGSAIGGSEFQITAGWGPPVSKAVGAAGQTDEGQMNFMRNARSSTETRPKNIAMNYIIRF